MKPFEFSCAEAQPHLPLLAGAPIGALGDEFGDLRAAGQSSGDLEPALAASVRAHTTNCAICAAELQRIENALEALASVRDEHQLEVDLWGGIRAELASSGVLRTNASEVAVVASPATNTTAAAVRGKWWMRGAHLRRWSAAAGFMLALGTAAFFMSNSDWFGSDAGGSDTALNNNESNTADSGVVADVVPTNVANNGDVAAAPIPSSATSGGLRRATLEEQRQFLRPAQSFNAQTRDASSSGGVSVAGDRRLR